MDSPRPPDRETDPEGAAAYAQATWFRNALREEIQRLDVDRDRLAGELAGPKSRLAAATERALGEIDAERRHLEKMLSALERRFPQN